MPERRSEIDKYVLGVTIVVSLIIGGGTGTGLPTDMAIQLLAVAASTFVCLRHMGRHIDSRVFWFMVLAGLAVVLQILPISTLQIRQTQGILPAIEPIDGMDPVSISLGLGRTVEVAAYFLTLCLFVTAVLKLRFDQVYGLIPFFLVGVALNLTAGLIQYSYSGKAVVTDLFSYDLEAGFFVNSNHYSSLIFTSIPIAFVYFIETNRLFVLIIYVAAALLILLAAGSTAGVVIGFAITLLSIVVLFQRSRIGTLMIMVFTIGTGIYSVGLWARLQVEEFDLGYGRLEFARTTLEGIRDNLPFGIGYGNFVIGYPGYEKSEMIFDTYVNHAHNEYLELVFEGGIGAAALLIIFLCLFLWRVIETIYLPLHKAATLSILFILIHSVVDYPLRTLGMAIPFSMFVAFLFHRGPNIVQRPNRNSRESARQTAVEDPV
jgi:O-antigen ligase